jgi:hypothetical protein
VEIKTGEDDDGMEQDEFPFVPHDTITKINRLDPVVIDELLTLKKNYSQI